MRLLKTHSHTSNDLAMASGKREEKQLKETQTLQQGKPPVKNLSAYRRGGGEALRQRNHRRRYDKANVSRKEGEHRR